ncbi:hypothetical protein [Thiorhodococcus minor]|uniref:Pilus assembly protein n=1 Tax=Thiorhodococcus minor TaxID=57489 RepID=A0A6M0K134_9GAMM|nr:hypothetical protein [Thiorhodococcus minor]NEV63024.1 hypothetical protein [Thiorhodococcus minor]
MIAKGGRSLMTPFFLCCSATLLMVGCATDGGEGYSPQFGESVRQSLSMQTADPASNAPGLSGVKAMTALQAYRRDVGDFNAVDDTLSINVGN